MILLWYSGVSYHVCREVGETWCIQFEDIKGDENILSGGFFFCVNVGMSAKTVFTILL